MQLTVLLFAAARDRAGAGSITVEVADDAVADDALRAAIAAAPGLAALAGVLRVAVNHAFVDGRARLRPGDEVALLPPVSGGAGRTALVTRAISLDALVDAVSAPGHGGVATFTGVVRDHSDGRRVHRLDYEAYPEMASKVLRAIAEELELAHPGVRLAIEHRTGTLAVGEVAVAIAAGAPHRREALAACAAAIDEVKARVPIWKREHTDAGAEWVACHHRSSSDP